MDLAYGLSFILKFQIYTSYGSRDIQVKSILGHSLSTELKAKNSILQYQKLSTKNKILKQVTINYECAHLPKQIKRNERCIQI